MQEPKVQKNPAIKDNVPVEIRRFRPDMVPKPSPKIDSLLSVLKGPGELQRTRPFDIEIGSGAGLFAIQYCQQNPDRFLLAIEKTAEKARRLLNRRANHSQLTNLLAVNGDARSVITHCVEASTVDRIFLWYPNPNPKNPAQRWFRMPFTQHLIDCLKPGGEIFLATNLDWYAEEARRLLASTWKLKETHFTGFTECHPPRTHFEKKYLERGETCWEMRFQKPSAN